MNSLLYNAFGQDFSGDDVGVKADERARPLFMLPPMYNGYTSYTCPILEDEYEGASDSDNPKQLSNLGPGRISTRSRSSQGQSDSKPLSTQPKKNPNTAKSENA